MHSPERLTEKLVAALGANLRSVVLYGSAAVDGHTRRYSDLNLMLVVERADADTLDRVAVPVRGWVADGQPAPVLVAMEEIRRSQDVFPIEFSDLKERHRVLHGDAGWIAALAVRNDDLRRQLEFELRSKLLLLRQSYFAAHGRPAAEEEAAARALSSVSALLRATLRLLGQPVPATTPAVIAAVQARVAIDGDAWDAVWRLRQSERAAHAPGLLPRLIDGLEALVDFVDAHGAS